MFFILMETYIAQFTSRSHDSSIFNARALVLRAWLLALFINCVGFERASDILGSLRYKFTQWLYAKCLQYSNEKLSAFASPLPFWALALSCRGIAHGTAFPYTSAIASFHSRNCMARFRM